MLGQRLRRWPDIEATLDKCTMFVHVNTSLGSGRFDIPAVIQSVCLQANDQVGANALNY